MRYQYGIIGLGGLLRANCRDGHFPSAECFWNEDLMARIIYVAAALLMASLPATVRAQDVPGIEICTVEKTMERRTSCLQSNVDFLQKTISKLTTDHQQKIDAANRQIEALKGAVVGLQKVVSDMQTSQNKAAEDAKKAATPPAKDTAPAAKDAAPAAKDAAPAKDGTK
jgi:TolA-binding protein